MLCDANKEDEMYLIWLSKTNDAVLRLSMWNTLVIIIIKPLWTEWGGKGQHNIFNGIQNVPFFCTESSSHTFLECRWHSLATGTKWLSAWLLFLFALILSLYPILQLCKLYRTPSKKVYNDTEKQTFIDNWSFRNMCCFDLYSV